MRNIFCFLSGWQKAASTYFHSAQKVYSLCSSDGSLTNIVTSHMQMGGCKYKSESHLSVCFSTLVSTKEKK